MKPPVSDLLLHKYIYLKKIEYLPYKLDAKVFKYWEIKIIIHFEKKFWWIVFSCILTVVLTSYLSKGMIIFFSDHFPHFVVSFNPAINQGKNHLSNISWIHSIQSFNENQRQISNSHSSINEINVLFANCLGPEFNFNHSNFDP